MPRHTATKVCPTLGCPLDQPCPTHTPKPWAGSTRRIRLPSNWSTLRRSVLKRDHHRCRACGAPATEVDHVVPGDNHHPTNLQALCHPCHTAKTTAEATAARLNR